jgi:hypothetical protein
MQVAEAEAVLVIQQPHLLNLLVARAVVVKVV